jgi:hypothetical protein
MHRRAMVLTAGCIIVVVLTALAPSVYAWLAASSNQAPYVETPSPPDGVTGLHPSQVLSWIGVDDDGDPLIYAVALGTTPYPWPIVTITTLTSYTPTLNTGTTYYWYVAVTDSISTTVGPVWRFTTNYPPQVAYPVPPDGAAVDTTQTLGWTGSDADSDPLTYTIAFGTSEPPPVVLTTTLTCYTPTLSVGNTYYWRITATDGISIVDSPTWHFSTFRYTCLPLVLRNH